MRVGVDARSLAAPRGVAHYTEALLDALARGHRGDEWVLFAPGRGPVAALARLAGHANVTVRRHVLGGRPLYGAAAIARRPRLDRLLGGGLDVVWAPAPAPLALSGGVPLVLTVHDLSFELRPRDFTAYERFWHRLARPRRLAHSARLVMVDAATTRELVLERWGLAPARVRVVAPGVTRPAPPATAPVPGAGGESLLSALGVGRDGTDYLLAVGALEPRKAPELLVAAFTAARREGLAAELVLAGGGRLAGRLRAPDVHVLGHVSAAELEALYGGALALVMASWLEGFGLPPLEAAARGVPALVADLPVYRETLGEDGALRFAPGDQRALARALVQIATDAPLRARLVAAASAAVSRLTWEATAHAAHAVLAEAAAR